MNRLVLPLLPVLLAAACASEGIRARSDVCPPNEVCSDLTPDGLYFAGSRFAGELGLADSSVKVTAAGGTQTIEVRLTPYGDPPPDFAAEMAGTGWAVVATDPSEVEVAAASAGAGFLRIADPDNDELYDAIELEARAVERAELRPAAREIVFGDHPWVLLASGSREVYVDLRAAGDVRLVDESLAISGGEPVAWDVVAIDAGAPGEVSVEAVTGAGQQFELAAQLVAEVDEIEVNSQPDGPLPPESASFFCFRARTGAATAYGANWSFRASGSLSLDPNATVFSDNCPIVQTGQPGTGVLVVEAGDRSLELEVEVAAPSAARAAPGTPASDEVPPSPGLRAGG